MARLNLTTSKGFKALSLDEIMAVPLAKQEKHEAVQEVADNLSALNPDVHESRRGYADEKIGAINQEIGILSKRLGTEGFSPEIARRMNQLKNKQIIEFSSGQIGKDIETNKSINANILALKKDKTVSNSVKEKGLARAEAEYAETGIWNDFVGEKDINVIDKAVVFGTNLKPQTIAEQSGLEYNAQTGLYKINGEWTSKLNPTYAKAVIAKMLRNDASLMRSLNEKEDLDDLGGLTAEETLLNAAEAAGIAMQRDDRKITSTFASKQVQDAMRIKNMQKSESSLRAPQSQAWTGSISTTLLKSNEERSQSGVGSKDLISYNKDDNIDLKDNQSQFLPKSFPIMVKGKETSRMTKDEFMYAVEHDGKLKDGRTIELENISGFSGGTAGGVGYSSTIVRLLDKNGNKIGVLFPSESFSSNKGKKTESGDIIDPDQIIARKLLNPIEGSQSAQNSRANRIVTALKEQNKGQFEGKSDKWIYEFDLRMREKDNAEMSESRMPINNENAYIEHAQRIVNDYASRNITIPGIAEGSLAIVLDQSGITRENFDKAIEEASIGGMTPSLSGAVRISVNIKNAEDITNIFISGDSNTTNAFSVSKEMMRALSDGEVFTDYSDRYPEGIHVYGVTEVDISKEERVRYNISSNYPMTEAQIRNIDRNWGQPQKAFNSKTNTYIDRYSKIITIDGKTFKVFKKTLNQEIGTVTDNLALSYDVTGTRSQKLTEAQSN